MASDAARRRYWARSFAGWHEFSGVRPNAAHEALARLQSRGWLQSLITQNVDRLHHKAGSADVIELHGTTHRHGRFFELFSTRVVLLPLLYCNLGALLGRMPGPRLYSPCNPFCRLFVFLLSSLCTNISPLLPYFMRMVEGVGYGYVRNG